MLNRSDYLFAVSAVVLIFLLLIFLTGGRLDFNPDGANALHVAQNIVEGEGITYKRASESSTDQESTPDVNKPLLFPVLIAGLIALGLEPSSAGSLLTLASFSSAAGTIFLIARLALPRAAALLISCLFVIHIAGLRWALLIHEQWLFISLSFASLLLLSKLHVGEWPARYSQWFVLGAVSAAALLTSYQGFPLVATVTVFVFFGVWRQAHRWRQAVAYLSGLSVTALVPFARFVILHIQGLQPGFQAGGSESTFFAIGSSFVHTLQIDFLGRLVIWLGETNASDIASLLVAFGLLAGLLWFTSRQRSSVVLSIYIGAYIAILVLRGGFKGSSGIEPRLILPISLLMIVIIAIGLYRLMSSDKKVVRQAAAAFSVLALVAFLHGQFLRLDQVADRWSGDYVRGYCPSPKTMAWVKAHIPDGAVIMSPQCGYQIFAEANQFFWLRIPPADEYPTWPGYFERWTEEDLLEVSRRTGAEWLVILNGRNGDPLMETPGYGPFVTDLMNGSNRYEQIKKLVTFQDGMVYRVSGR